MPQSGARAVVVLVVLATTSVANPRWPQYRQGLIYFYFLFPKKVFFYYFLFFFFFIIFFYCLLFGIFASGLVCVLKQGHPLDSEVLEKFPPRGPNQSQSGFARICHVGQGPSAGCFLRGIRRRRSRKSSPNPSGCQSSESAEDQQQQQQHPSQEPE